MKVKLIKQLNIRYSQVPKLTRDDRRALQRGEIVDVPEETAEFLLSRGFVSYIVAPKKIKTKSKLKSIKVSINSQLFKEAN